MPTAAEAVQATPQQGTHIIQSVYKANKPTHDDTTVQMAAAQLGCLHSHPTHPHALGVTHGHSCISHACFCKYADHKATWGQKQQHRPYVSTTSASPWPSCSTWQHGKLLLLLLHLFMRCRCCMHTQQHPSASPAAHAPTMVLYTPVPMVVRARGLSCIKAAGQMLPPYTHTYRHDTTAAAARSGPQPCSHCRKLV